MKNLEKFLEELTEVSRKHGLVIVQGCCGTPSVMPLEDIPVYETEDDGRHLRVRTLQEDLN